MKIFLLSSLLLFSFIGHAQITGTVTDEAGESLPGASVAVYNQADELIDGTTTDGNGRFSLDLKAGQYLISITSVSFKDNTRQLELTPEKMSISLGQIKMQEAKTNLEEVQVEADAKQMEFKHDKRIFNVSQELTSKGSNASELLNNIPSVTVDIEGNVGLRGSQNVRILVNGKPSGLIGSDPAKALRQLPSNLIERVEVITNPSARYDAEGQAGIINIIMKKNQERGLNGTFETTVGYPENYGASAGINYRTGKVNLFMNSSFNYNQSPGGGFSEQNFFREDTAYSFIRDRDQLRGGNSATIRLGADYYITAKQSLTGSFLYRPSNDRNQVDITYRDFDVNNNLLQTQIREDRERETERMMEGDLHWEKNYEKKGHKWSADLQFQDENDHERSDINQYSKGENENLIQRVSNIEDEENFMLQTDYVRPLTEDRGFEVGSRLRFRNIRNDYMVEEQNDQGNFIELPDFTNNFLYTENVYAGYGIYKDNISEKITYQGGLRLEYTGIITELLSEDEPNQRDYLNLFPSASMTYEFNPLSDMQVSYSRRIDRPNFWSLLLFFSVSGNRVFFSGNPDLNPEFADSYEVGYMRYWEKASLYSGLYYRHTMGKTERITTVDSNGFTTIFPINLSVEDAYGFEFNYQHDLTNWWSINANINLFHSVSTGNYDGVDYGANTFSSSGRVNSQVEFWKSKLQASFNFRGPRQTAQGRNLGIYSMNLGWSKDLLNEKATLTLSVQDVFNSRKRRSYTNGPGFESYSEFQWRQRQINLSFTYRLNQNKSRKPASRGSGDMGDGEF